MIRVILCLLSACAVLTAVPNVNASSERVRITFTNGAEQRAVLLGFSDSLDTCFLLSHSWNHRDLITVPEQTREESVMAVLVKDITAAAFTGIQKKTWLPLVIGGMVLPGIGFQLGSLTEDMGGVGMFGLGVGCGMGILTTSLLSRELRRQYTYPVSGPESVKEFIPMVRYPLGIHSELLAELLKSCSQESVIMIQVPVKESESVPLSK